MKGPSVLDRVAVGGLVTGGSASLVRAKAEFARLTRTVEGDGPPWTIERLRGYEAPGTAAGV